MDSGASSIMLHHPVTTTARSQYALLQGVLDACLLRISKSHFLWSIQENIVLVKEIHSMQQQVASMQKAASRKGAVA